MSLFKCGLADTDFTEVREYAWLLPFIEAGNGRLINFVDYFLFLTSDWKQIAKPSQISTKRAS
jgi:hypothetical protein